MPAGPLPGSDEDLVSQCRAGNLGAFEVLFRRYHREVYRTVYQVLRNRDDALEAVQETFVKAFRHLGRYDGRGSFGGWLRRIAVNLAVDSVRRRPKLRGEPLAAGEEGADLASLLPAPGPGPDRAVEARELAAALGEALAKLPPIHRAVIVLKEIEGMSCDAVAAALQCSVGTVMSRLHHARRKLQRYLTEHRG